MSQNCNKRVIPWRKVYLRIFMLQKQIYHLTKKHKLNDVYNIQMYLVNSNEAKVIAMRYTLKKVLTCYFNIERNNYATFLTANYYAIKVVIKKYLLRNKTLSEIREIIKQQLIYLSLEPYKKAKITQNIRKNIYKVNKYLYQNIRYLIDTFNLIKVSKNISTDIVKLRLQLPKYITRLIVSWLRSGYIIFTSKVLNININYNSYNTDSPCVYSDINSLICNTHLADLISQILFLDIVWYIFIIAVDEKCIRSHDLYLLNELIDRDKYTYKLFHHTINNKYSQILIKDFYFITKINQNIKSYLVNCRERIIKYLKYLYYEYITSKRSLIDFFITNTVNTYINILIYNYLKKRYIDYNNLKNIRIFNNKINLYTYRYNLDIYYLNLESN